MTDTVVTRIRLPGKVHRQVKAQAAYHSVNLDEALGLCVAFLCGLVVPLTWMGAPEQAYRRIAEEAMKQAEHL